MAIVLTSFTASSLLAHEIVDPVDPPALGLLTSQPPPAQAEALSEKEVKPFFNAGMQTGLGGATAYLAASLLTWRLCTKDSPGELCLLGFASLLFVPPAVMGGVSMANNHLEVGLRIAAGAMFGVPLAAIAATGLVLASSIFWFPALVLANNLLPILIVDFGGGDFSFVGDTIFSYSLGAGAITGVAAAFAISKGIFDDFERTKLNVE